MQGCNELLLFAGPLRFVIDADSALLLIGKLDDANLILVGGWCNGNQINTILCGINSRRFITKISAH